MKSEPALLLITCVTIIAIPTDDCSLFWENYTGSRTIDLQCGLTAGPSPWLHKPRTRRLRKEAPRQTFFPEFIHIAKNGGGTISSVRFAAQDQVIGEPFNGGMTRFQRLGTRGCHDGETPPRGMKNWHRDPTFCVVRHPLTHIVSSMNYAAQGKHERDKAWVGRSLHQMAILIHEEQIRENNEGFLPDTFDRKHFNQSHIPLAEKHTFIGEQYCHFLPQSDYIWNEEGERTCNYVLRYEHFHDDFKLLSDLYGQNPVVNENIENEKGSTNSVLDQKEFKSHVNEDKKFSYLDMDEELSNAYLKLYEVDLCLLGYDRDPAKPVESLMGSYVAEHKDNFRQCFHERDPRVVVLPPPP